MKNHLFKNMSFLGGDLSAGFLFFPTFLIEMKNQMIEMGFFDDSYISQAIAN